MEVPGLDAYVVRGQREINAGILLCLSFSFSAEPCNNYAHISGYVVPHQLKPSRNAFTDMLRDLSSCSKSQVNNQDKAL